MKRLFTIFFISAFCLGAIFAQTGMKPGDTSLDVFAGSGQNEVLLSGFDQYTSGNVEVTVTSANTALIEVLNVEYTSGDTYAKVLLEEKGTLGTATLNVTVDDDGAVDESTMDINVVGYDNPGMKFEIHDVIFWKEEVPLGGVSVYDEIIQTSEGPYDGIVWDEVPLTVSMDCTDSPPCTGHDFFTALYQGYIVPPTTGTYTFYMESNDNHGLWLSEDANFDNASLIAARSDNHGNVGTEEGGGRTKSAEIQLEAGKPYAIYGVQWIIHDTWGGILWEGPDFATPQFINGENMMPILDTTKPSSPEALSLEWRSSEGAFLSWNAATDDNRLAGYNLYVNGLRHNEGLIEDLHYQVSALDAATNYEVLVTAVDAAGNESFVSNEVAFETYPEDNIAPQPPTSLNVTEATGLAVQVEWSGAVDNETEVIAYNLYVDGVKYNSDDLIYSNSLVIKDLEPSTEYNVTLEAVDASFNISNASSDFAIQTVAFDPLGPDLGVNSATAVIEDNNISWNHGIGLNGPYNNGDMVDDSYVSGLVEEFGAGAIRWGAIEANSKSLEASSGTGKSNTYANMLNFANQLDAYFALTVGVQDGIDYRTDSDTFLNLLEYLAGPSTSTWGEKRAAEGFEEPLLQNSKGLLLEFGNEVWGAGAHDAEIGADYEQYIAWVRDMADVVRSSPYYDPDLITMVYSGRKPHPGDVGSQYLHTTVFEGDQGAIECLGVSGYMGGNLDYEPEIPMGESELDYYKSGMSMLNRNIEGFQLTMHQMLQQAGEIKTFYLYESNMTTSSYNGRFGQGLTMTDYLAASMEYGSIVPSIFHLTGGQWRIVQVNEDKRLPLFEMGKLFNAHCKGHVLKTELISNGTIQDPSGTDLDMAPVGTYAYNNGTDYSVMLINRDFEDKYTVQVDLPDNLNFNTDATLYTVWNDDYSSFDTNMTEETIQLSDGMLVDVPKHAMVLISAQVDNADYEKLPLGYFTRQQPETLTVTDDNNG
ncbi:MAG: fibronectin type III domain-containing protein, partial [Bacteroidota bacterium]